MAASERVRTAATAAGPGPNLDTGAGPRVPAMGILKATLWTLGAMVALGALVGRADRGPRQRLIQTTLDHETARGVNAWP